MAKSVRTTTRENEGFTAPKHLLTVVEGLRGLDAPRLLRWETQLTAVNETKLLTTVWVYRTCTVASSLLVTTDRVEFTGGANRQGQFPSAQRVLL